MKTFKQIVELYAVDEAAGREALMERVENRGSNRYLSVGNKWHDVKHMFSMMPTAKHAEELLVNLCKNHGTQTLTLYI